MAAQLLRPGRRRSGSSALAGPSPVIAPAILMLSALMLPAVAAPVAARQAPAEHHHAQADDDAVVRGRLGSVLATHAGDVMKARPMTTTGLEAARQLLTEALELDPTNLYWWRLMLDLATLMEDEPLRLGAADRIVELDPGNDVAQFVRIMHAVRRHQTAEHRRAALERLLEPSARSALSPALAARLALELATLCERQGDGEAFRQWLVEAGTLDPSYRTAASITAGYFRSRLDDPAAEAELLIAGVYADPSDMTVVDELAGLLLRHGAYEGAGRMLGFLVEARRQQGLMPTEALLADLAIAQWAIGRPEDALSMIRERQINVNLFTRRAIEQASAAEAAENDSLLGGSGESGEDVPEEGPEGRTEGQLSPTLALVRAAIHDALGRPMDRVVEQALDAFSLDVRRTVARIEEDEQLAPDDPRRIALASRSVEAAWMILWLGGDLPEAETIAVERLGEARSLAELTPVARRRFEGWVAYRRGLLGPAFDLLDQQAETDVPSRLGRALIHLDRGEQRSAAEDLLAIVRDQPGTVLGVWCADRLARLLDRRVPISEEARSLEALMRTVPATFDRYPEDPSLAIGLELRPHQQIHGPFDPLLVDVILTNNTAVPIAIDPDGPIRPLIAIEPTIRAAMMSRDGEGANIRLPASFADVRSRFRIEPRSSHSTTIDLRATPTGRELARMRHLGAFMRLRGISNVQVNRFENLEPGLLGLEYRLPPVRVDGARISFEWLESTLAELESMDDREAAETIVLIASFRAALVGRTGGDTERIARIERMIPDTVERFGKLPPEHQAWIISIIPKIDATRALTETALANDHRLVRLVSLLTVVPRSDDPLLVETVESDDPTLGAVARQVQRALRINEEASQRPTIGE